MKKIVLTTVMCAGILFANAQLIKRDFLTDYSIGENLEKGAYANTDQNAANPIKVNQWNLSGKTGLNDQGGVTAQTTLALTYPGYIESGMDVSIAMAKLESGNQRTTVYSLASDNTYGAGVYYVAFMTNVIDASPTTTHEYVAFDGNYTGNAQRARIGVRRTAAEATTFGFGLSGSASAPNSVSGTFNFGETYLVVLKVVLTEDAATPGVGTGEGTAYLYINPDLNSDEPAAAFLTAIIEGTALKAIRGLVVRQRSTIEAEVGGFRFAKTWADAIGKGGSGISGISGDKGEIVAVEYYTVTGCKVSNPGSGIYIQKNSYQNGAVETVKFLK